MTLSIAHSSSLILHLASCSRLFVSFVLFVVNCFGPLRLSAFARDKNCQRPALQPHDSRTTSSALSDTFFGSRSGSAIR
jgi:hypothetical protein